MENPLQYRGSKGFAVEIAIIAVGYAVGINH
jgi:hypothetical protein